jgi:hypothetical protein
MHVVFPEDYIQVVIQEEQLIPAGTTAHVVFSDPEIIIVVPHVYLPLLSDIQAEWKHEVQWLRDEYEDHPDVIPFVPGDQRTHQLRRRRLR